MHMVLYRECHLVTCRTETWVSDVILFGREKADVSEVWRGEETEEGRDLSATHPLFLWNMSGVREVKEAAHYDLFGYSSIMWWHWQNCVTYRNCCHCRLDVSLTGVLEADRETWSQLKMKEKTFALILFLVCGSWIMDSGWNFSVFIIYFVKEALT